MDKQELIDILEKLECSTESLSYDNGYEQGIYDSLSHVILLDEPKKVVIPQFVADWFEDNFEELDWELGGVLINAFNTNRNERSDFQDLLVDTTNYPIETLIRMKLFGYEVEKEQLYKVVIDHKYLVQLFSGRTDARLVEYEELTNWHDSAYKLTESVIKSIDERYWPFAVKVDGEQMKYKTRYSSIVPKGQIGECIDKVDGELLALLIKFGNGEVFWFMKRDLIEVEDK